MRKRSAGPALAGLLAVALAGSLAGCLAGCETVRITGGTSEVGNPVSALDDRDADDSAASPVIGFGISVKGAPIRLLREDGEPEKGEDAAQGEDAAPATLDSLPVP